MQRVAPILSRVLALFLGAVVIAGFCSGCDLADPEVVVVNRTAEDVLLKNISFRGALWEGVLGYGESTSVARCLPGKDRVHFQRLVLAQECEGAALMDADVQTGDLLLDDGLARSQPAADPSNWFNYQTMTVVEVRSGDYRVLEIRLDGMEQDFSTPGPYGH